MINGAHVVVFSTNPAFDRAFFRDILRFTSVDAGNGWLILGLPPAEAAFHPAETNDQHELYLMCDDLKKETERLHASGVECAGVVDARWGSITKIRLPGGGEIGLYEPKHPRPKRLEYGATRVRKQEKRSDRRAPVPTSASSQRLRGVVSLIVESSESEGRIHAYYDPTHFDSCVFRRCT